MIARTSAIASAPQQERAHWPRSSSPRTTPLFPKTCTVIRSSNPGGGAAVRLHERGARRPVRHSPDTAGAPKRRDCDPGAAPARGAHRALRDRARREGRPPHRRLLDDLAHPRRGRAAIVGASKMARDISERKRAEAEKRRPADAGARRQGRGRARESPQGRVPRDALARAPHSARRDPRLAKLIRAGVDRPARRARRRSSTATRGSQAQLIDDLLDVSRIIAGKLRLERAPLDLARVIRGRRRDVRPAADAKGVAPIRSSRRSWSHPRRRGPAPAGVLEPLSNAIKFTPKGGRVERQPGRDRLDAEVASSDTGPESTPVPALRLRALPAGRLVEHTAPERHRHGTRDPRSLVELHGGVISAVNRARHRRPVHRHDAATQRLAAARGSAERARAALRPWTGRSGSQTRRRCTVSRSSSWTTSPTRARSWRWCWSVAAPTCSSRAQPRRRCPFCCAIAPTCSSATSRCPARTAINSSAACARSRARAAGPFLLRRSPAYAGTEDRMKALKAGFQMHIPKPVQPAELATVVASLAERDRAAPA